MGEIASMKMKLLICCTTLISSLLVNNLVKAEENTDMSISKINPTAYSEAKIEELGEVTKQDIETARFRKESAETLLNEANLEFTETKVMLEQAKEGLDLVQIELNEANKVFDESINVSSEIHASHLAANERYHRAKEELDSLHQLPTQYEIELAKSYLEDLVNSLSSKREEVKGAEIWFNIYNDLVTKDNELIVEKTVDISNLKRDLDLIKFGGSVDLNGNSNFLKERLGILEAELAAAYLSLEGYNVFKTQAEDRLRITMEEYRYLQGDIIKYEENLRTLERESERRKEIPEAEKKLEIAKEEFEFTKQELDKIVEIQEKYKFVESKYEIYYETYRVYEELFEDAKYRKDQAEIDYKKALEDLETLIKLYNNQNLSKLMSIMVSKTPKVPINEYVLSKPVNQMLIKEKGKDGLVSVVDQKSINSYLDSFATLNFTRNQHESKLDSQLQTQMVSDVGNNSSGVNESLPNTGGSNSMSTILGISTLVLMTKIRSLRKKG